MLIRLRDQIACAAEEAKLARAKALCARAPDLQHEYFHLEKQWLALAKSLEFAAMVSGYLEWSSQRLKPPPS